jgi:serine/threonine-protein kinase
VVPIAIAAILVLGLIGGAWAFRDRIPGLGGDRVVAADNGTSNSSASTATTSSAPVAAVESPTQAQQVANEQSVAPGSSPVPGSAEATASTSVDGPGPRASQADVDALQNLPAARAAEKHKATFRQRVPEITEVARITEPVTTPARYVPTIAVVIGGDDVITEPARDAVVSCCNAVASASSRAGEASVASRHALLRGRADAVVFQPPVGSQHSSTYGRVRRCTVQMGVKAHRPMAARSGAAAWNRSISAR